MPSFNCTLADGSISRDSIDSFFLLSFGMIVFFLQAGFAMLEAGCVSSRNVTNVLYKNLCDTIIGAIVFYFFGYGFAFGGDSNDFIGSEGFALNSVPECDYAMFFFQFTFAATAVTIVSGAVAERCTVSTYVTYSMYITGFVYPVVVYWVWSGNGWLWEGAPDNDDIGYRDFAGSGVVHMTGGAAALAACFLMGPRKRRIGSDGKLLPTLAPHSTPLVTIGAFILMFGFFAFNGGSQLALVDSTGENGAVIALAVVNTIMAAAGGGLACGLWSMITTKKLSLLLTVNGVIGGMVASCASANVIFPWAALIIGAVAGLVVVFWSWMLRKCGVDDAIDAIAVHLGCGWWGVMAEPLFNHPLGIFFRGSNPISWDKLGWNLAGSFIIFVWAFSASFVLFYILKVLGVLRVSAEIEEDGLDETEHGEKSYEMTHYNSTSLLSVTPPSSNGGTSDGLPNFSRKMSVEAL